MSVWSQATEERAREIVSRYPERRSAVMPLLYISMIENAYVTADGMRQVGVLTGLSPAQVQSVASFYTMYKRDGVGRYLISVCTSISCALLEARDVLELACGTGISRYASGASRSSGVFSRSCATDC